MVYYMTAAELEALPDENTQGWVFYLAASGSDKAQDLQTAQ